MSIENSVLISGTLIGVRELIVEFEADPDRVALEAGLPAHALDDPQVFVQANRIIDYLELAAAACEREDFGLLHARRLPLAMLGPGWMVMRAAETVKQALMDFVRLYPLYTDAGSLRVETDSGGLWLLSSFLPVGRFGTNQAINLTLGAVCLFVRENLPRDWHPQRVHFRHTPNDTQPFIDYFGSGVCFGCERDALFIDRTTLGHHIGEGAERRAMHERLLQRTTGPGTAVVAQVRSLLRELVRHDACTIELISEALAMSPRTLQRRLAVGGTSYRALVDEARADLAWRQVTSSELSMNRIAGLLGYNSPAAFSRAFSRWHGMSPRVARRG